MWFNFWRRFTKFIDPKLEKFREHKKEVKPKYTPTSLEDFIGVVQRTPKSILSSKDRDRIASIMSFDERKVSDLMTNKEKMIFVSDKEFLGPLMLDKLFRSGFTNFPVTDSKGKVKGIIHTEAFNALEIKNTDRVDKYIDKQPYAFQRCLHAVGKCDDCTHNLPMLPANCKSGKRINFAHIIDFLF